MELEAAQAHYLRNVLRLSDGAEIHVFNGRDGEWRASFSGSPRRPTLVAVAMTRQQEKGGDIHYLFAPLKHARHDYMVQKAVEMGASLLQPVLTRHTQTERINTERMRANAIEAAEQCGILALPRVAAPAKLENLLAAWPQERLLIFCDEEAEFERSNCRASRGQGERGSAPCRADRAGGRVRCRRTDGNSFAILCCSPLAWAANPARRYCGGGGHGSRASGARRLAKASRLRAFFHDIASNYF